MVLYEKNINEKLAPASTTKIMTAMLTLEKCKLDDKVVVGKAPPFEDGSKIYLFEGEEITVKDLLYAMMLESANDAALALAEHIGGSKEGFAALMNQKAKELGCYNTNFTTPNGLYEENHYTTAYDLSIIAREAMKNDKFREIVTTLSYQIKPTNKQPQVRYMNNLNKFLTNPKYKYEGTTGVKNGYTTKSKNTLVASAVRGDLSLLAVALKDENNIYEDVAKLLDYGFDNFSSQKILSTTDIIKEIKIGNSDDIIPAYPENDFYIDFPKGSQAQYTKNVIINSNVNSIKKGEKIGFIEIKNDSGYYTKVPLVSGIDYKSLIYNLKTDKYGNLVKIPVFAKSLIPAVLSVILYCLITIKVKRRHVF
jgi:D-alanyl-D-alanine carboxypeptidase